VRRAQVPARRFGGALAIKSRGGIVIVEDPATAQVPDMPLNVLRQVGSDYCLPVDQIGSLLVKLASNGNGRHDKHRVAQRICKELVHPLEREVEPQGITCPECGGVLDQMGNGAAAQYRCHVGHTFSVGSLTEGHTDALERALWIALRSLNEQHTLQQGLARSTRDSAMRRRYQENAEAANRDKEKIHEILAVL